MYTPWDDVSLKTLAIKVGGAMLRSLEQTHSRSFLSFLPKGENAIIISNFEDDVVLGNTM